VKEKEGKKVSTRSHNTNVGGIRTYNWRTTSTSTGEIITEKKDKNTTEGGKRDEGDAPH